MQDKDNNMNEWADRGWADMAALLDAEMPVRRRRRRAIWWWLPLLLLPVFAAGWFFFQDPQLEKAEPALSPVAQADKADIHSAEPVLERTEDRGQKPERESPAGLVNAGVQGTNKGLGSQHKAHIPPVASDLVEPAEPLQSALDAEAPEQEQALPPAEEEAVETTPSEEALLLRWAKAAPVIDGLTEAWIRGDSPPEPAAEMKVRQDRGFSPAPRYWEASLQLAANPDYALGGVGVALEAAYPLGRKAWSLRPGIFYLHQQQDIDVSENSAYNLRVGEVFNNAPVPGSPFRSETLFLNVAGLTLGVSYQPASSWTLRGGLGMGWIIEPEEIYGAQSADEESLLLDPSGGVSVDQLTSELQDFRTKLVEEEGLNRQVFFAYLGVSRQLTSRLSVRADLQLGLSDLSRDRFFGQRKFDGLHQLRLGLGYRW